MSELGFGPWRAANEAFIATFERSYQLYEQRIGAPSSVDLATGTRWGPQRPTAGTAAADWQ